MLGSLLALFFLFFFGGGKLSKPSMISSFTLGRTLSTLGHVLYFEKSSWGPKSMFVLARACGRRVGATTRKTSAGARKKTELTSRWAHFPPLLRHHKLCREVRDQTGRRAW